MDKGDGSIKYILTGDGAGTTFTIDDSTGDIHAIQRLDREVKSQYMLRAQARNRLTDRPLEPESEFIVKIQDINDNEPKFLDGPYQATVPEMSKIGKVASASLQPYLVSVHSHRSLPGLYFYNRNICDPVDGYRCR